jgi:hypothetical protein
MIFLQLSRLKALGHGAPSKHARPRRPANILL